MAVDYLVKVQKNSSFAQYRGQPMRSIGTLVRTNKAACGLLFQRVKHLDCNIVEKLFTFLINRY